MELLQLKYFLTVANTEHISRAAEALCITQPSLSKTISRLEAEVGAQLFDRYSRNIKLNENGKIFLKHIERMFFELEEAQLEIENNIKTNKTTISIAAVDAKILSDVFDEFSPAHPNVIYKSHIMTFVQIEELLLLGGVDIAVAEIDPGNAADGWESLTGDELYAVLPFGHRLFEKAAVTFHDIANENIIIYPPYSYARKKVEFLFYMHGSHPHILYEDDHPSKVLSNMKRAGGISFINKNVIPHILEHDQEARAALTGIRLKKITSPVCSWQIGIRPSEKQRNSHLIGDFIRCAKAFHINRLERINAEVDRLCGVADNSAAASGLPDCMRD